MPRRSRLLLVTLAVMPLTACTASSTVAPHPRTAVRLVSYDSCADLATELRAATSQHAGLLERAWGFRDDARALAPEAARASAADSAAVSGSFGTKIPDFSGTNVHEEGVDEPDLVKTDGRIIVTVTGGVLHVIDPATRTVTGRLALGLRGGGPAELLLAGDRALVLASGSVSMLYDRGILPAESRVELVLIDLGGPPRVIGRYLGDGHLIDARQTGSIARVVLGSTPRIDFPRGDTGVFPRRDGLPSAFPDDTASSTADSSSMRDRAPSTPGERTPSTPAERASSSAAERASSFRGERAPSSPGERAPSSVPSGGADDWVTSTRRAIETAPADAWLPTWEVTSGGRTTRGRLSCNAVSRPTSFSGTSMLRVITFDLAAPALGDGSPVAVVSDGDIVYGTADSLYVANNPPGASGPAEIFRFALPPTGRPVFASSGTVPGRLLNQYSLSEWDGHLRVATTDPGREVSAVRVLREQGDRLAEVGEVGGLGQGEQIYAVRFLGPRAYVVTFRRTDPLYGLDLTDPTRPLVTGELKITGYSSHLQPVGPDRLIGIGQESDAKVAGSRLGTQVSLFDVADPARPRRLARTLLPGAYSEAEYDPHAVLWWAPTGLLAVPVADDAGSGALVLRVTATAVQRAGRLAPPAHSAMPVRRTLVVGSTLWTVTDAGLLATDLSSLDRLGWISLT